MRQIALLLALLLPALIQSHVISLANTDELAQFVKANSVVFLKIFSKKCGHCKAAEKPFSTVSQRYGDKGIAFGEIDGDKNPKVMEMFGIKGFPGMFVISGAVTNRLQYMGPVSEVSHFAELMDEVLVRQHPPQYKESAVETLKKMESYVGYGVYCGNQLSSTFHKLQAAATVLNNLHYFTTENTSICKKYGIAEGEFVYVRISGQREEMDLDRANLMTNIAFLRYDDMNPFKQEFFGDAIDLKVPLLVFIGNEDSEEVKSVKKASELLPTQRLIPVHNTLKTEFEKEYFTLFGYEESEAPMLLLVHIKQPLQIKRFEGKWTPEAVAAFVSKELGVSTIGGTEGEGAHGEVEELNTDTMFDFLYEKQATKVIFFYKTGSAECDSVAHPFHELAAEFSQRNKPVKFGRINVGIHVVPSVKGVPGIAFFNKDFTLQPKMFEGQGTKERIREFIQKMIGEKYSDEL